MGARATGLIVGLIVAVGVAVAPLRAARADEQPLARCSVRIVHALHELDATAPAIDPRLTRLRPYLDKPPFTAWKQFKLLDDKQLPLPPRQTDRFDLPNGKVGSLTYVDHLLTDDKRHRLRLRLQIHDGARTLVNTVFVLDEGGVVVQAGQHFQKGLLILGVSCEIDH
jgi:hypothetical protein